MVKKMMMVGNLMRRRVVSWQQKALGQRIPFSTMTQNTYKDDHDCQILMSPSLVSLDLPDLWPPDSTDFQFQSAKSHCEFASHLSFHFLIFICFHFQIMENLQILLRFNSVRFSHRSKFE